MAERVRHPPAWALAAVLAAVYLLVRPPTADHAAQEYRASLGPVLWDNAWYGGHHMPAYSVLFPPLAALLGPALVGALAAVAAAALFERLVADRFEARAARLASLWFALGTASVLVSGRLTFLLGTAIGLGALLAAERRRTATAAALAVATALASPVAAAFVALGAAAWLIGGRGRRVAAALTLGAAALVPVIALTAAFPEGGSFPFVAASFLPSFAAVAAVAVAIPREERVVRAGALLYAAAMVASFVLDTPVGGNAVRLGALAAGPVIAAVLWQRNRRLVVLLAAPLLWFQWAAAIDDWARAGADPSVRASYYDGLLGELARLERAPARRGARLEVPFTDNHWESRRLAPHVALARGWERQLDVARNAIFYDGRPLTPARYRRWLDDNAVAWVALADAPIDYSAAAEAALVRAGPRYLREVWRDDHWRLFAVRDPAPLAAGSAAPRVVGTGHQDVRLRTRRAGTVDLRVRFSPYWALEQGRGCVRRTPDDRVQLVLRDGGDIRLGIRFALARVGARGARCTG